MLQRKHSIPHYALYGDAGQPAWADMVHFERIHERSGLHDFEIAPHVHDGLLQLLYLQSGGGRTVIDGRAWDLQPGSLMLIPSQAVHGHHFTRDVDGPVVTAAQRPLESLLAVAAPELLATLRQPVVLDATASPRHAEALMPLFDAIAREARVQAPGQAAAGSALLVALFVQIGRIAAAQQVAARGGEPGRGRRAAQIERFRALVDAHFRERWPVERYAGELGISAGQLSRLCRETLGMSSLDVLNARVVHEAQRQLVYATLSIKQVSSELGFADEAYFGRFFRKHTGQRPTDYRAQARRSLSRDAQPAGGVSALPGQRPAPAPVPTRSRASARAA